MNDISVLEMLVVGGLAVVASAAALLSGRGPAKTEDRHRRRRARLHVIAGGAARTPRRRRLAPAEVSRAAARLASAASWEAMPVTQWQPPREQEEKPGPSPAA